LASLVDRYVTLITVMMGRPRKVNIVTYSEIMVEFELRYQMYTYIAFDWVLGDIRPLIVRTVCTTVRKIVCCMCLRKPNASLPQQTMSLIWKTLVIIYSHCCENLQ
jgi:hypothetical protein